MALLASDSEQAYQFLTQAKSRDILADVYGCCPPGLISALGKFGAQARQKEFYAALFGVLQRGGPLAKYVHHLNQISDETIFALAAINDHPPSHRILKILLKRSRPDEFTELTWVVSRLLTLIDEDDVEGAITSGGNPSWTVQHLFGKLTFPVSPFSGDSRLQPIKCADELFAVGRTFKNCLADRSTWFNAVLEVLAGRTFFFRWQGDQPAIISFNRIGSLGWIPHQFEAENSEFPNEDTRREVEDVFRRIPEIGPITMRTRYRC